jgi:hypothetical protein
MSAIQSTCFAPYFYRVNPDKTIDSICSHCFKSSPAASGPGDLRAWESAHHCDSCSENPKDGSDNPARA